jgi:hypothetical protein
VKNIISYFVARAKERSTWLGLVSLFTALGLVLNPQQQEAVVAAGMAAAGLIAAFSKDRT